VGVWRCGCGCGMGVGMWMWCGRVGVWRGVYECRSVGICCLLVFVLFVRCLGGGVVDNVRVVRRGLVLFAYLKTNCNAYVCDTRSGSVWSFTNGSAYYLSFSFLLPCPCTAYFLLCFYSLAPLRSTLSVKIISFHDELSDTAQLHTS
jgi:hypothetical protein